MGEVPAADTFHLTTRMAFKNLQRHSPNNAHIEGQPIGKLAFPGKSLQAAYPACISRSDGFHFLHAFPPFRPIQAAVNGAAYLGERCLNTPYGDEAEFSHDSLLIEKIDREHGVDLQLIHLDSLDQLARCIVAGYLYRKACRLIQPKLVAVHSLY